MSILIRYSISFEQGEQTLCFLLEAKVYLSGTIAEMTMREQLWDNVIDLSIPVAEDCKAAWSLMFGRDGLYAPGQSCYAHTVGQLSKAGMNGIDLLIKSGKPRIKWAMEGWMSIHWTHWKSSSLSCWIYITELLQNLFRSLQWKISLVCLLLRSAWWRCELMNFEYGSDSKMSCPFCTSMPTFKGVPFRM